MGDRANIVIETPLYGPKKGKLGRVYLYSHWGGERIVDSVLVGLKSGRSTDASYLTRIIFQDMLEGDTTEIGYGISVQLEDNEHPIVVVRPEGTTRGGTEKPTVHIENAEGAVVWGPKSYEEFITAVEAQPDKYNRLDAIIAAG